MSDTRLSMIVDPKDKANWEGAAQQENQTLTRWTIDRLNNAENSVEFSADEKAEIEKAAKEHGVSFSDFVKKAVAFHKGLDAKFWKEKVESRSESLNVPVNIVVQNTLIKRWAYDAAVISVYQSRDQLLDEFVFTANGIQTGMALYERMRADFIDDLKRNRAAYLRRRISDGKPISDHEIKWLEDYNQEQAAIRESRERDEMDADQGRKGPLSPDEMNETQEGINKNGK